jgi:hypothetical protein
MSEPKVTFHRDGRVSVEGVTVGHAEHFPYDPTPWHFRPIDGRGHAAARRALPPHASRLR